MRAVIILGVLGLFFAPGAGVADDAKIAANAKIALGFDRLEGLQVDEHIEVRFVMSQASWSAVQRANIRPVLKAEVLSLDRKSHIGKAGIVERSGRFIIVLPEDHVPTSIRFALQHPQVEGFLQAGVSVVTVTHPIGGTVRRVVDEKGKAVVQAPISLEACEGYGKEENACKSLVKAGRQTRANVVLDCGAYGKHDRIQCLREVSRTATDMSGAVRGCAARFSEAITRLNCVRRAAVARVDPSAGVRACGAQFSDDGRALECVARIAYTSANAQGLVDTCSNAFGDHAAQLGCIGMGARSNIDLSPAVLACTQAMPWLRNRQQCIAAAAASKIDLSSAIDACRVNTRSPEAVLRCVRHAAQGRKPGIARAINGCGRAAGNENAFDSCVAQASAN